LHFLDFSYIAPIFTFISAPVAILFSLILFWPKNSSKALIPFVLAYFAAPGSEATNHRFPSRTPAIRDSKVFNIKVKQNIPEEFAV